LEFKRKIRYDNLLITKKKATFKMQIFTNLNLTLNRSIQKNFRFIFPLLTFSLFSFLTQAGDVSKPYVSLDQERIGGML